MPSVAVVISAIFGWIYFLSWSVSFYPQAFQNWKKKSVTGLSIDYIVASVIGFFCYSLFALCMYTVPAIKAEYRQRHDNKDNLVALNDVIFAVDAFFITSVMLFQVILYRKPHEKLSKVGLASTIVIVLLMVIGLILSGVKVMSWLDYLYGLSYIKLVMTVVKYIPQVYMNYARKSTVGWNVYNVILDFIGGIFSMAQLVLDSWISKHWSGISGFAIKLGLGIVSIFFDIVFLLQHFVIYRHRVSPMRVEPDEKKDEEQLTAPEMEIEK